MKTDAIITDPEMGDVRSYAKSPSLNTYHRVSVSIDTFTVEGDILVLTSRRKASNGGRG